MSRTNASQKITSEMKISVAAFRKGREHARASIAEGLRLIGRLALQVHPDCGEQQGECVGKVVAGIRQQRQAMRTNTCYYFKNRESERGSQRQAQNPTGSARMMVMVSQALRSPHLQFTTE